MGKTMRNIVITCIALILVAALACAAILSGGCSGAKALLAGTANPFASLQTAATGLLVDATDARGHIESQLYAHVDQASALTGIPASEIEAGIESLDIQDWQVVEKPAESHAAGSFSASADGVQVGITTYDDPSIVTVEAYGQEVTFEIPDSAQDYLPYLRYLDYLS